MALTIPTDIYAFSEKVKVPKQVVQKEKERNFIPIYRYRYTSARIYSQLKKYTYICPTRTVEQVFVARGNGSRKVMAEKRLEITSEQKKI